MRAGAHLVQTGQIGNDAQMGDAARVRDGGADVIDELLLNQIFAVPHSVKNFPYRQRCGGVMSNELEGFLIFSRCGVF